MTTVQRRQLLACLLAAAAALLAGCAADVAVRPADPADTLRDQLTTRLTTDRLSSLTRDALNLLDLRQRADEAPLEVVDELRGLALTEPDAPWRLAATELLLDQAERAGGDASLYLACAREADLELQRAIRHGEGLLDARTEFAADLYHRAVSRFLSRSAQPWLLDDVAEPIAGPGGAFDVRFDAADPPDRFGHGRFDRLDPTDLIQITGMRNHHRIDAWGAPVVAIREQRAADPPRAEPFLPPEGLFVAATATLRFDAPNKAFVELWNPDRITAVDRYDARLRLSTDVTAPVAALFARAELVRRGHQGLTDVEAYLSRIGIYLHEPYDPDKIPVLMVHGLRSSPATWRDMLNDLRADPAIRGRYQFWMFYYPSGLPVPRSAAYLRRALHDVRAYFDPQNVSPTMDRMVLLGHSMGGLLSKAMVQSSGDALWRSLHPEPFDEVEMSDDVREHLREVFFYEPDPDIARIVFIATPHRGSAMASSWIGRIGDAMIRLPDEFLSVDNWFDAERARLDAGEEYQLARGVPTSIDDLQPDSPHLLTYLNTPMRADLPYHLIAGDADGDSDGVVTVDSAIIGGGESALVVDAFHDAHAHPLAIREVRRILLLHSSETPAPEAGRRQ